MGLLVTSDPPIKLIGPGATIWGEVVSMKNGRLQSGIRFSVEHNFVLFIKGLYGVRTE